jgi:hypothetical protein
MLIWCRFASAPGDTVLESPNVSVCDHPVGTKRLVADVGGK